MTTMEGTLAEMPPAAVAKPIAHDSAAKHVTGQAFYIDDLPEPPRLLHAYLKLADIAHGHIAELDVAAVRTAPGVAAVLTAADLKFCNDIGPVQPGDPVLSDGEVLYWGQPVFAVAARSIAEAREAAALATVAYQELPAILTIDEALAAGSFVLPSETMQCGDAPGVLATAPHRLSGRLAIGGQEHFYLEGQVAMAIPQEDGDMLVLSSTQHPSEVQHLVAKVLGRPDNAVVCEVRRMGGGFGGKETQAALFACVAALLADRTGRPVKLRPDRDDDMIVTGKRHDFIADYDVGFGPGGRIVAMNLTLASRCGYSPDLSGSVNDRAMLHADNCYYIPNALIRSHRCKTHTVSNTAFRGFGGPQGMMAIEHIVDEIARFLGKDPLSIRKLNLYGKKSRNVTPYRMTLEDNIAKELIEELEASGDYARRRAEIAAFNATSPWIKRGIALTPVKFGISFTAQLLNQAGALVHVYTDGSVHLNHGGTEMGQGLFIKVAQVVADELGIDLDRVKILATSTAKVPNTSPTAASSGSDLNGKAAQAAARTIRDRLASCAAHQFGGRPEQYSFAGGMVRRGDLAIPFKDLVKRAYAARLSLSSTGYYRTPKIHYDSKTHTGRPFYYFAYGAALTEIELDTLTGEYRLMRADILHDCGESLNPAVDLGQVEGGFVQGMGWLTSEELCWDERGRLMTHAPSTYKIPTASDVPADFRVSLYREGRNREPAIYRSKAVGEPPLMLGISVFHAIRDAIAAAAGGRAQPHLDAPATPERVLWALEELRGNKVRTLLPEAAE